MSVVTTTLLPANNNGPCLCQAQGDYMGREATAYILGLCTAGSYVLGNPADSQVTGESCGIELTTIGLGYTATFVPLGGTLTGSGSIYTLEDSSSSITLTATTTAPNMAVGPATHSPTFLIVNAASLSYFLNIATTVSVSGPASTSMPPMTTTAIAGLSPPSPATTMTTSTSNTNDAVVGSSSPFLGTLLLAWSAFGWLF